MRLTILTLLLLCIPMAVAAETIHVPGDQPTIQAGINAAVDGDTVLVADGTYTGDGNRDIHFLGKAITVRSENGAENCIINCEGSYSEPHRGFTFQSGEGPGSVIQGFIIRNGCTSSTGWGGGGIYCNGSSPTISNNVFLDNWTSDEGGAICCGDSTLIIGNYFSGNIAIDCGGGLEITSGSPLVVNNVFEGNEAGYGGGAISCWGGSPQLINNLIVGNNQFGYYGEDCGGGGIACYHGSPVIISCTLVENNTEWIGGGIFIDSYASVTLTNCILWGNTCNWGFDQINGISGATVLVEYSDVMGGWTGIGNLGLDPLLATGPDGDYYLSQVAAGQGADSPCVDAGDPASGMIDGTTRTDEVPDIGQVDMGYHYAAPITVSADLNCGPDSGTVPFTTQMTATLTNQYKDQTRRIAGRIEVTLASGSTFPNWREGYSNVAAADDYVTSWNQNIPSIGTLIGDNLFALQVEDVTPAPYNQPPYPPAGDTDTATCTVTGIAP